MSLQYQKPEHPKKGITIDHILENSQSLPSIPKQGASSPKPDSSDEIQGLNLLDYINRMTPHRKVIDPVAKRDQNITMNRHKKNLSVID